MSRPAPASVLVVVTRQIGDVLLTTPLIRRARALWPKARIDVLGFEGTLGMLRGNPDVDECIGTPPHPGLRGSRELASRLWRRYELALVAEVSDRAHLIGWIAARERNGLLRPRHPSNWWKRPMLAHVVTIAGDRGDVHVVQEKLRLLEPWDGAANAAVVPPPAAPLPPDIASQLRDRPVVMHVPSMWAYKQWPPERFRAVAAELIARGHQVVLTGAGGERDQQCIAPLRDLGGPPQLLDVSGRTDLNQVRTLLERAALYIGPDTSVSHLAAAVGVPTLVVFGPTNPSRWAPWPATAQAPVRFHPRGPVQSVGNTTVVQSVLPCVPCGRAGCEDHQASRSDCLRQITPGEVLAQALALLERRRT